MGETESREKMKEWSWRARRKRGRGRGERRGGGAGVMENLVGMKGRRNSDRLDERNEKGENRRGWRRER